MSMSDIELDMSDIELDVEWEDVCGTFDHTAWLSGLLNTDSRRNLSETLGLVNFVDIGGCPVVFRDEAHGGRRKTVTVPSGPADAILLTLVLHNATTPMTVPMPVPNKKLKQQHSTLDAAMPDIEVSHLWCKPGDTIAFKTREVHRGFVLGGDYGNISEGGEALFTFVATPFTNKLPQTSFRSQPFMVRSKRPQVPTGTKRGQPARVAKMHTDLRAAEQQLARLKEEHMRLRLENSQWTSKWSGIELSSIPEGPLRLVVQHFVRQPTSTTNRARI